MIKATISLRNGARNESSLIKSDDFTSSRSISSVVVVIIVTRNFF